jgi:hypothetical protein
MISEGIHIPLQPRRVTHRLLGSKRKTLTDLFQNRVAKMAGAGFGSPLPSHIQRLRGVALRLTPVTFDITVRDTQKCRKYLQFANRDAYQDPSLKNLALEVLGRLIKQGRVSSVEDAIATMEIYQNANADIEQEQGK